MQRLKGAIDSRIAEEQARQRSAVQSASPSRSGSTAAQRSLPRNVSPSKRPRPKERTDPPAERGPDPSEFDSDVAVGDDSSDIGVSKIEVAEHHVEGEKTESEGPLAGATEIRMTLENGEAATPAPRNGELSTEVRVKLRKLQRLEGKYQELLRAYRSAHARVQAIEPFEASLRENTPLTSINDPGALLEYLNQITLKSDMVLDELKRVAAERDDYRKKSDASEKETEALKEEVAKLKQQARGPDSIAEQSALPRESYDLSNIRDSTTATAIESTTPIRSPTLSTSSRIPSFSLFSPKSKAAKSPPEEKETSEDFFSYDSELPRLETELQERQAEIVDLKKQVSTLQRDLAVARESTEGMVQSLESATRELHTLRDTHEKYESARRDHQVTVNGLQQEISSLTSQRAAAKQEDSSLDPQISHMKAVLEEKETAMSMMEKAAEEGSAQLTALEEDALELRKKLGQKDITVKDLEDSLAMAQSAERQMAQQSRSESASQKQIGILNNIMESLRSQLKVAEGEIMEMKEVKRKADNEIEDLLELKAHNDMQEEARRKLSDAAVDMYTAHICEQPSTKYFGFVNNDDFSLSGEAPDAFRRFSQIVKKTRPELYEALIWPEKGEERSAATTEVSITPSDTTKKSRKKKRKNKGGQGSAADQTIGEPLTKVTETLDEGEEETRKSGMLQSPLMQDLEMRIKDLERQILEKDATIDHLSGKVKDQDVLKEEIETLRDDLLHQGEGHVEARDALKATRVEKSALEERIVAIQKELADLKTHSTASSAESGKAHEDLISELVDLKKESGASHRELAAAEQLAASRFKDITDLREVLSKAQPELRSLRSEVEELRLSKEDLKNKIGELTRLEARHEDLETDMKNLSRKMVEKDAEIKDLRQKLAVATGARVRAEEDLRISRSNLQDVEAAREAASQTERQTSEALSKAKADYNTSRSKIRDLEEAISNHAKELVCLKEEIGFKTTLYDSTQAMLVGLKEQAQELSTQAREASSRADSLEEELAEAQRMLSERSREGETMRRLLADVEGRTVAKIRELKERMETAIEERDRVEDEASTSNRRMAREVDDLRNKTREVTRSLKAVEEEKEELQRSQKDWKRRRDELESSQERGRAEVAEAQAAIQQLREALDQRERDGMEFERQKADVKRMLEEAEERAERLQKANKSLTDEMRSFPPQRKSSARPPTNPLSEDLSSRSSLDSTAPIAHNNSTIGSPVPNIRDRLPGSRSSTPTGLNASNVDYVYLKNVLLQFLEQKDKSHQKQLIPVLGMLLNFDR